MDLSLDHPLLLDKLCDKNLSLSLTYERIKCILASLSVTPSFYSLSFLFSLVLSILFHGGLFHALLYNVVFYMIWTPLEWWSKSINTNTENGGNTTSLVCHKYMTSFEDDLDPLWKQYAFSIVIQWAGSLISSLTIKKKAKIDSCFRWKHTKDFIEGDFSKFFKLWEPM
jgi:hypothetical protein